MSDDPGYRPGGTIGGRCGCAAAPIVVLVAGAPLIVVSVLGNCAGEEACGGAGRGWIFFGQLAALAALGALLGFSVRASVNWLALRRRDQRAAGPPPLWALVGALALGGLALWVTLTFWLLRAW